MADTNGFHSNGNAVIDAADPRMQPASFLTSQLNGSTDPADSIPGMAANFGRDVVPHVLTFQSIIGSHAKVYRDCDEATKASLDNARFMRNDCGIMECVEARQRCVSLLDFSLEPEDENSHEQKELCAVLTTMLERIVNFTEYRYTLMHAIWYGKYAINNRYGWQMINGKMRQLPTPLHEDDYGWRPINGDKLVFRYDDGNLPDGAYPNQLGIRVHGSYQVGNTLGGRYKIARVDATDRGMAYFIPPWERKLITVHRHIIEDAAYEDAISAGAIHGLGIRSRIYWEWFQKQETLGFLMEYLERSAGGIEVWTYPMGNPQAKSATEEAARQRLGGARNVVVVPKPLGAEGEQYGVEIVEPGMAGIDTLKDILNTYHGHRIKRYILGQTLTSEAESTGLGSGVADAHMDTFMQIVRFDAMKLQETMTRQLVKPLKDFNFPHARGIHIRMKLKVEHEDVKEKLEAYEAAYNMGAALKESEVMESIGASIPGPGDKVLQMPQQSGGMPGMAGAPGQPGNPGGIAPAASMTAQQFERAFDGKHPGGPDAPGGPNGGQQPGGDRGGDSPMVGGPVNPGDGGDRSKVDQYANANWQQQHRDKNGRWTDPEAMESADTDESPETESESLRNIGQQIADALEAISHGGDDANENRFLLRQLIDRARKLSDLDDESSDVDVIEHYARRGKLKPSSHQKQLLGDDQQEFRWITIGGHSEDGGGEHHGGTHVKIDRKGNIVAGPKELAAKGIKNLHDFGSAEHPQEKKRAKAKEKMKTPAPAEHQPGLFEPDEELGGQKLLDLDDAKTPTAVPASGGEAPQEFLTAGQAAMQGLSHAAWTAPISEAYTTEQIDDDHPAWQMIQSGTAPTIDQYNDAKSLYGEHVRLMHNGKFGKVTGIADDAKTVEVTLQDGTVTSIDPQRLDHAGASVASRATSRGALSLQSHADYLGPALAQEALERGENISETMRRHGMDPVKHREIRAAVADAVVNIKAKQENDGKPAPSDARQRAMDKHVAAQAGPDETATETSSQWSPETHATIAADSIDKLRGQDVYRLLDSAPPERMESMANWIVKNRPDLSGDVHDARIDIHEERGTAGADGGNTEKKSPVPTTLNEAVRQSTIVLGGGKVYVPATKDRADLLKSVMAAKSRSEIEGLIGKDAADRWYKWRIGGSEPWTSLVNAMRWAKFDSQADADNSVGSPAAEQNNPSDVTPEEQPAGDAASLPDHVDSGELNRMDRKIERLKNTMESRRKVFGQPQQTPGPFVTGRSGYTQGKKLDAENDRKATAFREHEEARREYERLQSIRDGYIKGTNHPNGQPRVPGAVEARQAAKDRNQEKIAKQGFDTRKIYRDVNMDGKSTLPDGTVVSMHMDFDSDDGGYQFVVTRPDGTEERTPFAGSIARLQSGGELRKILSKSKSTAAETVPQQSEPDDTAPSPEQSTGPKDGDRNAEGLVFRDGRWHREGEQQSAQDEPVAKEQTVEEPAAKDESPDESGPLSLERLNDRQKRLNNGDVTAAELKQWYREARDPANLEAVKAELSKKTVDELKKMGAQGYYGREKKAELIDNILDKIGEEYHVGDRGVSFQIGGAGYRESKENAYRKAIEAITDDHIKAHAEKVAARRAELQSRREAFIKSVENPETLEDFDKLARVKGGEENLTPEQRQKYDDLRSTTRRAKAAEQAAKKASVSGFEGGEQATGGVGIVEGHHKKRNVPTFTVTVENHLGDKWDDALSRAKRLGGSYVNARIAKAYGATPGFQFFDKDKAEQFANVLRGKSVDRTEDFEKEQAERTANRAASLQDRGADIVGAGESDLNRDRKDNTARRAAMAASAESSARAKIATGKTLQAIGEKMEAGELKHLSGVKAATHVDTLNSLLRRTRYERWTEENNKRRRSAEEAIKESRGKMGRYDAEKQADEKHGGPLPDYDTFHEAPASEDDISAVKYPYPRMWQSDLRQHAEQFADVPGLKKIAATLKKAATEQIKFQGSVGGMKASGGSLVSPKSIEEQFNGKLLGVDPNKKIRVHASWDWRLAQASQSQGGRNSGQFYTADKGKTWSDTPEKAALVAYNKNMDNLDLVDAPEDRLVTFDDPKDIEAMRTAASRLRRSPRRDLQRIGENLNWQLEDYKRMQAMDIQTPAELRAALREYLPLRAGVDREDPIKAKERALRGRKIEGFFPTPRPLIDRMLDVAQIKPGESVLEPSAGKGDILDAIRQREPEAQTEAIEPVHDLRDIIQTKGHKLAGNDFLAHKGQYDKIIMNPPFEKGADIDHVRHAYDQLKPGGRLVAIMSTGPFHRSDKKAEEFRDWLDSVGGEHEENPDGSFAGSDAFRQTGVNTRMVTIEKPTTENYSRRFDLTRTAIAFENAFTNSAKG